ncbi:hypothetical protein FB451DRAFT_322532 [Mycena latifolia]|nr:hypothetical protein FB451DRAFT_322532 [Mycena latifolia]
MGRSRYVIPGPFLAPSPRQLQPAFYIPSEPRIALNPQLTHHRSLLHPHVDWDAATSPFSAILRYGPVSRFPIERFQLEQYTTSPPVKYLTLTVAGAAASLLEPWATIHVERTDGWSLRVGDVLNAIYLHLARPLRSDEINGMPAERWEHVLQAFNRRVRAAEAGGDVRELVMQRRDYLDGQTLFDGIQFVGVELQLSLL